MPVTSLRENIRHLSPGVSILIAMLVGAALGVVLGERAGVLQPLGDLFIRLLMMVALPLVFFNLLAGMTSLPDMKTFGRLTGRILIFFFTTSVVALALGMLVTSALKPGVGMTLTEASPPRAGEVPALSQVVLHLVPANVFQAFSAGNVAQILVFAVLLGLATLGLPADSRAKLVSSYGLLAELLRKLVWLVLKVAPFGIAALTASALGQYGARVFGPLGLFVAGVWIAHAVMVATYMALLFVLARQSPVSFLKKTAPLYATTAATCSSMASLVVSLDLAEKRLALPRSIYGFTLPLGTQIKKDGTTIMLGGLLMFTAQAAGVEFEPSSYLTIALLGLVLTFGSGGVPAGGLVVGFLYVQAFHLPLETAALVGGVYRLIDMGNTTVNCMGGLVGTTIVAALEERRSETK